MLQVMNERVLLPAVNGNANDYVADGVKLFLFLDLDGVFVPERYSTPRKEWFPVSKNTGVLYPNKYYNKELNSRAPRHTREPKKFELRWSAELVQSLAEVVALDYVQTVWVTTWRADMGGVSEAMGLRYARPAVYLPWGDDVRGESHDAKVPAVDSFLNGGDVPSGVRLAWLDDEALKGLSVSSSLFRQFSDEDVLLVKPVGFHGVSRAERDALLSFAS